MSGRPPDHPPALTDMHVHSTCSADGASSIVDYARRAVTLGLVRLGICEHVDFDPRDQDYGYLDQALYDSEIASARREVPQVQISQGVEIAYQTRRQDEIRAWLETVTWDYCVLSIHLLDYADGWAIISEAKTAAAYFATHNQQQAYTPYFEELLLAARSGLGNLLGHFDIFKRYGARRYGPFDPSDYKDEIYSVLRAAVETGTGLEINTSGLRQAPAETYPGLQILRWYRQLGGEILTIGSDAHHVDDLAAGIAQAQALARRAGFRALAFFQEGRIGWIDL